MIIKKFRTANILIPFGILITAATKHPFAPTWDMVNRFKNGKLNEQDYEKIYIEKLNNEFKKNRNIFYDFPDMQTFKCFCKSGTFCHRYILAKYLENIGHVYLGEVTINDDNIKNESTLKFM